MHRASEDLHLEHGYPPEHLAFLTRQRLQALLARCLEMSPKSCVSVCFVDGIVLNCFFMFLDFSAPFSPGTRSMLYKPRPMHEDHPKLARME